MKKIGYRIFALIYYICCVFPRKKNKVFCIMTHDSSNGSNVGVVMEELQKHGGYTFALLKKDERDQVTKQGKLAKMLDFFFCKPYHMATASYILQDNIFLPMAYMKFPKKVKIVQLWHGTGTIKKFGQSVNVGELGMLEKAADSTITHLIINGEATREIYQEAFGVKEDQIFELGLPRTDLLFDSLACEKRKKEFYDRYPELLGKRLVLYAPTFRDDEIGDPKLALELESMVRSLPEDMYLGLKLHPFVARNFHEIPLSDTVKNRVYHLSDEKDINQLLIVAYVLITDYSSVIFEYCVLRKPILFYAYDFEEFEKKQRGFYKDYPEFVPGDVVYTQEELVSKLCEDHYDLKRMDDFVRSQYRYTDGCAAKRLYETVFR